MLKNNVKKLIVTVISVVLLISIAYTTYATEGNQVGDNWLDIMLQGNNAVVEDTNGLEQIPEGTKNKVNTSTNTSTNTNANVNENKPATTPHAGLGDYSGLIFVAIFGVSAIYAYKKVKEYNV